MEREHVDILVVALSRGSANSAAKKQEAELAVLYRQGWRLAVLSAAFAYERYPAVGVA